MQSHIEEIRNVGGDVLAVSVDSPEQNAKVTRRYGLTYPLLSDPELKAIDAYGLRHPDGGLAGDIARPAVFVLDQEGRIVWRQLTENWRKRPRPKNLLQKLAAIP